MKRYDAWSEEEEAQRGYSSGSDRQELLEKTMGQYVTWSDHCKEVSALHETINEIAYYLAEGGIHMTSDAFRAIENCRTTLFQHQYRTGALEDTGAPEGGPLG